MIDLILLAAGHGVRSRLSFPKQLIRLNGKPLLVFLIEMFRKISQIGNIIVPTPSDMGSEFSKLLNSYNLDVQCVCGGISRQESVSNCLSRVQTDEVIIHESVRPFINADLINRVCDTKGDAVVTYIPSVPTIYYEGQYLDRNKVYQIQLPQKFNTELLRQAHLKAGIKQYTDDSSLVYGETGTPITFIEGLNENLKITSALDVQIAESLFKCLKQ